MWNSFLHVLINSPCRESESRAMHGIPPGWFSFPHLRKGKIFFFIITALIVIFKLFLSSLPLSHCFSSFHSCFLFIFFLSPSCFFFAVFRSVFSKARERRFISSSRVICKAMTLLWRTPRLSLSQGSEEQCYQHAKKEAFLRYSQIVSQKALKINVKT